MMTIFTVSIFNLEANPHIMELVKEISLPDSKQNNYIKDLELSSHSKSSKETKEQHLPTETGTGKEATQAFSPRPWSVLKDPLPAPPQRPRRVPSIRQCTAEDEFHSLIYYAKKTVSSTPTATGT